MIVPISIQSTTAEATDDLSMAEYRTWLCYGNTRVGKSRFAGTFPNPVFISDASERGWVTLQTMPREFFYHADRAPDVLPVRDQASMISALAIAEEWVRKGWCSTVVIDSLTFYAESWYQNELAKMIKVAGSKGVDSRALYGALASHLSLTRQQIHSWPCHVVWLALAAPPDDNNKHGGPLLQGKSRQRFPAGCDHIFYHNKYDAHDDETKEDYTVYEAHTNGYGHFIGGGRDSGLLPNVINYPTFRGLAEMLSLPEWAPAFVPEDVKAKLRAQAEAQARAAQAAQATPTAPATATSPPPPKAGAKPPVRSK